jgi:predicted regulator of Ras-like GTPase activity (Roadblock/LC7/MglB family)
MKFPRGTYLGIVEDPLVDSASGEKVPFSGKIEVFTSTGAGLFLAKEGEVIAACFREKENEYHGSEALTHLLKSREGSSIEPRFIQYRYGPEEMALAEELCFERGLSIKKAVKPKNVPRARLDEEVLARFMALQGVHAVLAFFEGFPVQTKGDVDFEHVAAIAEDFIRTAGKVALDLNMGTFACVIIEGDQGTCVIAPYGDLSLCILADRKAHLGMIRLAISILYREMFHSE